MNIIFLGRRHGRPIRLQLHPRFITGAAAGFVLLSALIGAGGYWLTASWARPDAPQMSSADRQQQEELQAMSARMADIQARMMRIDALGAHLAEDARLKGEQFDFSRKPPMGGPEQPVSLGTDSSQVNRNIRDLTQELRARESQLVALERTLQDRRAGVVALDNSPVHAGYITSRFGYRVDPITGGSAFHAGIDFAGAEGSDVYAVADGMVTWAGPRSGYGNLVEINHGNGLVTRYAHARAVAVRVGDVVTRDQLVAYMGSTGRSTGTHLHYEVLRNGRQVDPASLLRVAAR